MPRVFITYSHDSDEHRSRVLLLANRLRGDGIDVQLDQYEVHLAEGWLKWMQRQLTEADFVVVVCTETYRRRFDGAEAPGKGLAATWEGTLCQQILYDAGSRFDRFIPVLFETADTTAIPLVLRSATRYRLDAGYDDLYRHLTGQPKHPRPPLGKIRSMPPERPQSRSPAPTSTAASARPFAGGSTSSTVASRKKSLLVLLLSLFAADELRRWVEHDAVLEEVSDVLPGMGVSKSELVATFIDRLASRGLLSADFFARLRSERPQRSEEIDAAAKLWL